MNVSFFSYSKENQSFISEIKEEFEEVMKLDSNSDHEKYVKGFEDDFASYIGVDYCVSTDSGTTAIQLALQSLGVTKGDQVILPVNTYISTALAVRNLGAETIFADIEKDTFNIDVTKVKDLITEKTKAIIGVHLYGMMCNIEDLSKFSKGCGLFLIEDACQAHGANIKGKKAGSFGDVGCFSFHSSKNLGAISSGGAIVTDNKEIAEKIRILKDPDSKTEDVMPSTRTPCILDPLQAAVLKVKLRHIKDIINKKRLIADSYSKKLIDVVMTPIQNKDYFHTFHKYVIRTKRRDELKKHLISAGIETKINYPLLLHKYPVFKKLGYVDNDFPIASEINKEILSLPISFSLDDNQVNNVIESIRSFF